MPKYTQSNRPARVESPLGKDVLLLDAFEGEEGISVPFSFRLELLSEDPAVDADELLSKPMTVTLELGDKGTRVIHGLVRRFVQRGRRKDLTQYEAEIVPHFWFLGLTQDSRIFQEKSVPDIVEQIFGDQGLTDYANRCTGSYPKREYCVQYRETDFDFVSRLLEEEGIFYFFEFDPDGKKHVMVLADANSAIKPCPGQAKAAFLPLSTGEDAVVLELEREAAVHSTKVTLRDYDFLQPKLTLEAEVAGKKPDDYEVYDYPGEFNNKGEARRYARIRLEEREFQGRSARGRSSCPAFRAGTRFELEGHFQDNANAPWVLTSVQHRYSGGDYYAGDARDEEYENRFGAASVELPVRPARGTPRPTVKGSQTALVVGPEGEEIHVDKHGRVKVQFYWDREGKKDEKSSCWMRVASGWAGKNWGMIHIPRIGQEVLVDFLEGDPDRPLVTGAVYNAHQMPPYTLPGDKTQSGIKSRSSRGGKAAEFNEIRFEDKKGSELLNLHAQKDMTTTVLNDQTTTVGNNQGITVQEGDRTITVEEGKVEQVVEKEINSLSRTQEISHTAETYYISSVSSGKSNMQGNKDGNSQVWGEQNVVIWSKQRVGVSSDDGPVEVKAGTKTEVEAADEIELKVGGAAITITSSQIEIKLGGSSVTLSPAGVEVKGATITSEATGPHQVKGLPVKIN